MRDTETATFAFPSGGGFSNAFVRREFQHKAVANYLEHFVPRYGPSVFNRSGRAYPDVSANGYVIVAVDFDMCRWSDPSVQVPNRGRGGPELHQS